MLFGIDWHMWASFSTLAIIILWYNKNRNIWIEQAKHNEFVSKRLTDIKRQLDEGLSRREKTEKLLEDMDFAKSLEKKYDKLK